MKEHYAPRFYGAVSPQTREGFIGRLRRRVGFTLTEVVLAVGVLSLAIVALVGLFGPTMGAVKEVVDRTGALAVADQLNAQLLSDEIYVPLEINTQGNRFDTFAAQLITRPPNGTVAAFPSAVAGTGGVLYAWKQFRPDRDLVGNVELKLSPTPPVSADLAYLDGSVYLVFLERGLQQGANTYQFTTANVAASAYFPILVSIYEAPMNLISGGSALAPAVLLNYINNERGKPLFQYTTAKLR